MAPASDLAEGVLNDADRPPVFALVTNRAWTALGLNAATTGIAVHLCGDVPVG